MTPRPPGGLRSRRSPPEVTLHGLLAGTFATLTVLPLEALVQIGGTVALGILLDTFVVRALLVPTITHRLGGRAWWPDGTKA